MRTRGWWAYLWRMTLWIIRFIYLQILCRSCEDVECAESKLIHITGEQLLYGVPLVEKKLIKS